MRAFNAKVVLLVIAIAIVVLIASFLSNEESVERSTVVEPLPSEVEVETEIDLEATVDPTEDEGTEAYAVGGAGGVDEADDVAGVGEVEAAGGAGGASGVDEAEDIGGAGEVEGAGGAGGASGVGGAGGLGGEGGVGGAGGAGGVGGVGGAGGCVAGANTPMRARFSPVISQHAGFDDPIAGLRASAGVRSGLLGVDELGNMGTTALGPISSIQEGILFNESVVFEIFQTNGAFLGAPEGATNLVLYVNDITDVGASTFRLSAKDKDGGDLGTVSSTVFNGTVDVSAGIPGEIQSLTVEAVRGRVILMELDYTHVCLGYEAR